MQSIGIAFRYIKDKAASNDKCHYALMLLLYVWAKLALQFVPHEFKNLKKKMYLYRHLSVFGAHFTSTLVIFKI